MEAALVEARVVYCEEEDCGGLVKPDIVFFGESVSDLTSTLLSGQTLSLYRSKLTSFAQHTRGYNTLTYPSTYFRLAVCFSYQKSLGLPRHL